IKPVHILRFWLYATTALVCAHAHAETEIIDRVIVALDTGVVLQSEFDDRKEAVMERLKEQPQMPPMDLLNQQILDQLILEQIQIEEAGRYGMEISDAQLNQTLQSVIANNNASSMEEFAADLSRQGLNLDGV